ncbi:unnamed protein product, partial [Ilex paraguariensis]
MEFLEKIKELDAIHRFPFEFQDLEVPTIEDALKLISSSVRQVIIDVKVGPPLYEKGLAKDIISAEGKWFNKGRDSGWVVSPFSDDKDKGGRHGGLTISHAHLTSADSSAPFLASTLETPSLSKEEIEALYCLNTVTVASIFAHLGIHAKVYSAFSLSGNDSSGPRNDSLDPGNACHPYIVHSIPPVLDDTDLLIA